MVTETKHELKKAQMKSTMAIVTAPAALITTILIELR